ncbi:NmrA family NAD(P)-binding protein [Mucilaginibacter sp. dw_454]|uniref:NmrA family NAD(P)-binding protein n=1 Tax=Mucilaginibacter sp. dw_454 TaxID=2720079 RepID=UPI001BD6B016|nr:NmrA family NAD(P)-binding protein [Mucilaginibacter sp. dw_454]
MEKTKILITGATGATGAPTVEALLQKRFDVRAFVHQEDDRSARLKALGAEIFVGDLQNLDDVRAAWQGTKRGYFVYPLSPMLLDATVIFAQAAKEAEAEFIVNMSQKQVTSTSKSPATIRHFLSEEVFNWTGIPTTHLRPTFFSEWFLYVSGQIKSGQLKMSFPADAKHAPVAAEDLGRTAAAILADPEQHIGQTYQLFGPEVLSYTQLGEIVAQTLGKDIVYEQVSVQEMADLIGIGGYDYFKDHVGKTEGDNIFGLPSFNNKIEELIGKKPITFAEFIEKNRAAFIA